MAAKGEAVTATTDARLYRARRRAHDKHGMCSAGCGRKALVGYRYCRQCGAARVLAQRARLGQAPRSRERGGRESVYLAKELR